MTIYMIEGKPHRDCDCAPNVGFCPLGRTRTLMTTEFSRCAVPAPDAIFTTFPEATWHCGTVERFDNFGLGFVTVNGRSVPFTFDRIEGYRGEQPKEIGLKAGMAVSVELADGKAQKIRLEPQRERNG